MSAHVLYQCLGCGWARESSREEMDAGVGEACPSCGCDEIENPCWSIDVHRG